MRAEIGGYHPGLFYEGLLRVADQAGVLLSAYNPVISIEPDSQAGKHVQTEKGVVRAAQVIVATNGYTGTSAPVWPVSAPPSGASAKLYHGHRGSG